MKATQNEPAWLATALPAVRFFILFSRAEYALKKSGFLRQSKDAQASWRTFADVLGESFFSAMKTSNEAQELFSRPPRKQICLNNGELGWMPAEPDFPDAPNTARELISYVTQVRNNLFHGGKTPYDTTRDDALIGAATFVLEKAIALGPKEVRFAFKDPS